MRGVVPPLPQYAFMAWCSVKKAQWQLYLYPFFRVSVFTVYQIVITKLEVMQKFAVIITRIYVGSSSNWTTISEHNQSRKAGVR
jgi:hypothetical protein